MERAVETFVVGLDNTRDIAPEVLDVRGLPRVLPASYWATTTTEERALLGHRHGLYSFPTLELVDYLRELIAGRSAIEVGAGHGSLAEALMIPATDTREQERPEYQQLHALLGQPPVTYGPNVIRCNASRAVRTLKPQVVIGCWVTQNFDPNQPHEDDAKLNGVDEEDIIRNVETYILVGHEHVHQNKRIWARPHTIEYPSFVYSRAMNTARDFVAVWRGLKTR